MKDRRPTLLEFELAGLEDEKEREDQRRLRGVMSKIRQECAELVALLVEPARPKVARVAVARKRPTPGMLDARAVAGAAVAAAKAGRPCLDCGGEFPTHVMEFDHVPGRGAKLFALSHARQIGPTLEAVEAEIAKCDLVCANCHRDRTYRRHRA
jgi:hypothetical protein